MYSVCRSKLDLCSFICLSASWSKCCSLSLPAHCQPKQVILLIHAYSLPFSFPRQFFIVTSLIGPIASILYLTSAFLKLCISGLEGDNNQAPSSDWKIYRLSFGASKNDPHAAYKTLLLQWASHILSALPIPVHPGNLIPESVSP